MSAELNVSPSPSPSSSVTPAVVPSVSTVINPPSQGGGVFDNLRVPSLPADSPSSLEPSPPVSSSPNVVAPGQPGGESTSTPITPAPTTTPSKLYAGRYQSVEQLESAYDNSSKEGRRLAGILKERDTNLKKLNDQLAELQLQADLGQFVELSPEELAKLEENAPHKASEYRMELKMRKAETARIKRDKAVTETHAAEQKQALEASIMTRVDTMEADPVNFPGYKALQPIQDELIEATNEEITGYSWSPDILYLAAKGWQQLHVEKQSRISSEQARKAAAAKAAADAQQLGSNGAPTISNIPSGNGAGTDDDNAFNQRLIKAGPQPIFKFTS